MNLPLPSSPDDTRREQLSAFDESIRRGESPKSTPAADPEMRDLEQFLVQLNSIWPRDDKQKLCGYPLVRSLGQGTVGLTYLVHDPRRNEPLVLRILWPELAGNPKVVAAFHTDVAVTKNLLLSAIVPVKEVGFSGAICFVVSRYTHGQSLAAWRLTHAGGILCSSATRFVARLAAVLAPAHALGLTHGNIKPSNIFLMGDKSIAPEQLAECEFRVAEFGLAKAILSMARSSRSGLPWPSPQYLPPEQSSSQPPTPTSDVYALGVLLYELIASRSPVKGTTRDEVVRQTRSNKPLSPRELGLDIPPALDDLLMRCLDKEWTKRPQTGKQLAELLNATLLPEPPASSDAKSWWKNWLGWM